MSQNEQTGETKEAPTKLTTVAALLMRLSQEESIPSAG
jgi:hypothetical protein